MYNTPYQTIRIIKIGNNTDNFFNSKMLPKYVTLYLSHN